MVLTQSVKPGIKFISSLLCVLSRSFCEADSNQRLYCCKKEQIQLTLCTRINMYGYFGGEVKSNGESILPLYCISKHPVQGP